jgi:hypothetical protein
MSGQNKLTPEEIENRNKMMILVQTMIQDVEALNSNARPSSGTAVKRIAGLARADIDAQRKKESEQKSTCYVLPLSMLTACRAESNVVHPLPFLPRLHQYHVSVFCVYSCAQTQQTLRAGKEPGEKVNRVRQASVCCVWARLGLMQGQSR